MQTRSASPGACREPSRPRASAPRLEPRRGGGAVCDPFLDLVFEAATVHRRSFDSNRIQLRQLLNIKTGGCAENCAYCSQSSHFQTGLKVTKLMKPEEVTAAAATARQGGRSGSAWVRRGAT